MTQCLRCEKLLSAYRKAHEAAVIAASHIGADPHHLREKALRLLDEADAAIRELAGPPPLQSVITWVPVSERLPEDDQLVVISAPIPYGSLVAYCDEGIWRLVSGHRLASVTHWAELLTPPVGEEGEG